LHCIKRTAKPLQLATPMGHVHASAVVADMPTCALLQKLAQRFMQERQQQPPAQDQGRRLALTA